MSTIGPILEGKTGKATNGEGYMSEQRERCERCITSACVLDCPRSGRDSRAPRWKSLSLATSRLLTASLPRYGLSPRYEGREAGNGKTEPDTAPLNALGMQRRKTTGRQRCVSSFCRWLPSFSRRTRGELQGRRLKPSLPRHAAPRPACNPDCTRGKGHHNL
ncbi:hypothetical protein HPB50_016518 [Hyalomma asiaticum]|uniref:Uncharacterized protein n=1 Tax=Hyalomma asiaticum TaxID=266040 RepID=A0ACB7SX70_HYAAI|nr:hypothetical protein HPB50_016518 [Hyalomma asiaticum]